MADSLMLCHVSARPRHVVARLRTERRSVKWLFLCQDYLRLLEWQSVLSPLADHLDVSPLLSRAARQLRQPFLDLITELGRRYNSIAWWASRLSERNTMVSPLFLYCCYLQVGQDVLENTQGALCVIGENWEVLESLAEAARRRGCDIRWVTRPVPGRRQTLFLTWIVKRLAHFITRSLLQLQRDSGVLPADASRPIVLLRTWVDEACFGQDGIFHDRYLPGLGRWLEAQGCAVVTIPVLFSLDRSYRLAWEWLRHSRQQFLNPFKYYHFDDYLFALREAWQQARMPIGPVCLDGLDVSRLFEAERERAVFDVGSVESVLSYRLPYRLAKAGFRVDVFIDTFENMIPDKVLNLGFRCWMSDTKLVGFQHGALYPLFLCLFVTPGESEFAPMPDRVVCNGEFFRDILIREGLPADRAVVGPALRYAHLWRMTGSETARPDKGDCVLVPLPLVLEDAAELLIKVAHALGNVKGLQVIFKPHPMSSPEALLRTARLKELPSQFKFVRGAMGEWLARAHVVVAMTSSTIYEALAAGLPVIVVGREAALDLNPLAWYPDLDRVLRSPEEIRKETQRLLTLSAEDLARYRRYAREILHTSFHPVTDQAMHAFIDGFVNLPERNVNVHDGMYA